MKAMNASLQNKDGHKTHRTSWRTSAKDRRNRLKASAKASFQLSTSTLHPYNHASAVVFALAGGTLLTLIFLVGNLYNAPSIPVTAQFVLVDWTLNVLLFYMLFLLVFGIIKIERWAPWARWTLGTVGAMAVALLYAILSKEMRRWPIYESVVMLPVNVLLFRGFVAALMVLLVTWLIYSLVQRQRMLLENQRLSEENIRMRYDALVAQLDPHFLFNSLNTLGGLIGLDDGKARDYLQQLSKTYRYIIQAGKLVSFADELAFADAYCYLMQIRYGDGLRIQKEILPEARQRQIVPISLQLLVENAVKHNVATLRHPLQITISTPDADTLVVSNNLAPKPVEEMGEKVGLANLGERYRLVTSREVTVSRSSHLFSVSIPLLSK